MAEVVAVCVSEKKGEQKHEVPQAELKEGHGVAGDAHAGDWHRQVSLLGAESVQKVQDATDYPLFHGAFAENILTRGIVLYELPVGTRLRIGPCLTEVTQIGKECHLGCEIRRACGDCVMPREGIFVRVLTGGTVRAGDPIAVADGADCKE
ncbi:MAG: MOSC domain-containing protein [Bacillota bacterium]|nr:MOSC domain-containing protein [Bacillota bacterium]